jgi:hypothetical protein
VRSVGQLATQRARKRCREESLISRGERGSQMLTGANLLTSQHRLGPYNARRHALGTVVEIRCGDALFGNGKRG